MSQFYNNAIFWIEVDRIKPNPYQPPKETPKEKPRAQDYKSMFISALNQLLGK